MAKYYNKKPTFQEIKKLLEKENAKHPEGLKYEVTIELETPAGGRQDTMEVPKTIARQVRFKRMSPIGMIIIGACLLIIPLFF